MAAKCSRWKGLVARQKHLLTLIFSGLLDLNRHFFLFLTPSMTTDPQLPLAAGAQGEGCIFIGT